MKISDLFYRTYEQFRIDGFDQKYLPYLQLKDYLDHHFPTKQLLGYSFLGNDIYCLKIGTGATKVFVWSQMHGNESTGTRAMLDVFEFLKQKDPLVLELLKGITLYFLPMLNPDGATVYERSNAGGVDINRDFLQEASPEIRILKQTVNKLNPDFLFNLHDQRTIFNVGKSKIPATLAFLSPSVDVERTITTVRMKSMVVIDHIYQGLQQIIPKNIARFSDEFYPTSTGDNFSKIGFPTILMEAGHFPNDYERNRVRKFFALAIILGLEKIVRADEVKEGNYFAIPENGKKFLDIILRNVVLRSNKAEMVVDIGIYFEEKLDKKTHRLRYFAKIEEIGDLSMYFGHREIDKKGKVYVGNAAVFPKVGELADFSVGTIHFKKGKFKG